jgi:APA family basic amino acid/polyamine antiporter
MDGVVAQLVAGSLYAVGFGPFLANLLTSTNIIEENFISFIPFDKLIAVISIIAISLRKLSRSFGDWENRYDNHNISANYDIELNSRRYLGNEYSSDWTKNFADFLPNGVGGLVAAIGLTFIVFEGYEIIVQTGEDVKNPKKNIPGAIFISMAIVVIMYCLVAFVSIGGINPSNGMPAWNISARLVILE